MTPKKIQIYETVYEFVDYHKDHKKKLTGKFIYRRYDGYLVTFETMPPVLHKEDAFKILTQ